MRVNVDGVVFGTRAAIRAMERRGGGAIVATASLAGIIPFPPDPVYDLTKHAVVGFIRSVAPTLAAEGHHREHRQPGDDRHQHPHRRRQAGIRREAGLPAHARRARSPRRCSTIVTTGRTGECWVCQPGRDAEPYRFHDVPGPAAPTRAARSRPACATGDLGQLGAEASASGPATHLRILDGVTDARSRCTTVVQPEVVEPPTPLRAPTAPPATAPPTASEQVTRPTKLIRIASMVRSDARRGAPGPARRRRPPAPAGDPRDARSPSSRACSPPTCSRSSSEVVAPVHRARPRPSRSCASPRPSSSAGSRACSTASRPRCSPSRRMAQQQLEEMRRRARSSPGRARRARRRPDAVTAERLPVVPTSSCRCPMFDADWSPDSLARAPAAQQPDWPDADALDAALDRARAACRRSCSRARPARSPSAWPRVAEGRAFLLQAGDCAESFEAFSADAIRDKLKVILQMAVVLTYGTGVPTVKVGRIAGQFAKPRSSPTEIARRRRAAVVPRRHRERLRVRRPRPGVPTRPGSCAATTSRRRR